MAGRSLARVLRGEEQPDAERALFLQRSGDAKDEEPGPSSGAAQRGVRLGSYKLIATPGRGKSELYDLATDPDERHDVAAEQADHASRLTALLEGWVRSGVPASQKDRLSPDDSHGPPAAKGAGD
jgi:arylsulfatase A-like enzyme